MKSEEIKVISPSDRTAVDAVLTAGFVTCPMMRWFYPDLTDYHQHLSGFMKAYAADPCELRSGAYYPNGPKGALTWLTHEVHRDDDAELTPYLKATVKPSRRDEVLKMFDLLHSYHPAEPYWYMTLCTVDPYQQRQGLGGGLFKYALEQCDRVNKPAYLEASSASSARLYARFGFKLIEEVQLGSSPTYYPMFRAPQSH